MGGYKEIFTLTWRDVYNILHVPEDVVQRHKELEAMAGGKTTEQIKEDEERKGTDMDMLAKLMQNASVSKTMFGKDRDNA